MQNAFRYSAMISHGQLILTVILEWISVFSMYFIQVTDFDTKTQLCFLTLISIFSTWTSV